MIGHWRQLLRHRRASVAVIVAASLPVVIGAAALAVDLGSVSLASRRLQGAADAAALAAAADPSQAFSNASASVATAGWQQPVAISATAGSYKADTAIAPDRRFTANGSPADAVRVTLSAPTPTYFAAIFGRHSVTIRRTATAAQIKLASFSLGSRLAAVNGGIVNGYLSALTGSSISLTALDYNALAGADVDLFGFIEALHTGASLQAASYSDVLDAQVTSNEVLAAAAAALDADQQGSAAAALRALATQAGNRALSLDSLIDPGLLSGQISGGEGLARVNALQLVTAALQIASPKRQVALDVAGGVPGLAATRITVAIGERPAHSPWIAVASDGSPVLRTAQARIYAETTLGGAALPGIGGLVSIKLPLYVELASAEARLSAIDCSGAGNRGVTIEARPSPGQLAIAQVDTTRLDDFTRPVPLSPARLVHALVIDVDASAQADLGAAEDWQPLRFDQNDIDAGSIQTVSSGALTQSLAASLLGHVQLTPHIQLGLLGIPLLPASPITQAIGSQLAAAAPAVDSLLDLVTGTLGVHLGQADVRVTGMRCGAPALVG